MPADIEYTLLGGLLGVGGVFRERVLVCRRATTETGSDFLQPSMDFAACSVGGPSEFTCFLMPLP